MEHHRPTGHPGGAGGQRLQDHLLLAAEGTTHGSLDDTDMAHGHAQNGGNGGSGAEDGLSGGPDGHPIGGGGVVGHSAVGLHGDVAHPLGGGVVAELLPLGAGVVPIAHQGQTDHAILLVDGAGVLGQGLLRVKDGRQGLDVRPDELNGPLSNFRCFRHDGSNPVAHKAHMAGEQGLLVRSLLGGTHPPAVIVYAGGVLIAEHLDYPGESQSLADVQRAYHAVGHRAEE